MNIPHISPEVGKIVEEFDRASVLVDERLTFFRQKNACHNDVPAPVSPWIFWPVVISCSLVLSFAFCALGMIALRVAS